MADYTETTYTRNKTEKEAALRALEKAKHVEQNMLALGYKYIQIDEKTSVLKKKNK